jgi:hypothetical protein
VHAFYFSEFLRGYDQVGKNIVTYQKDGSGTEVKGSPVVPNSAKKIIEEGERAALFIDELPPYCSYCFDTIR